MNIHRFFFTTGLVVFTILTIIGITLFTLFLTEPSANRQLAIPQLQNLPTPEAIKKSLPLFSIIVENEKMSRPFQKGLSEAKIVYEAPTEGGITRFLAIFSPEQNLERIGPVRSARTYFLDWAHEYKGIFAHVGGHLDALSRLRRDREIFNAEQFIYEKYFWRENVGKTALEHTMFTSSEALRTLAEDQKLIGSSSLPFEEKSPLSIASYPEAKKITVNFGFPTYRVDYEYDAETRTYLRSQAKNPHIDQLTETQIRVNTVVIQKVRAWSNQEIKGTISIKTIGLGEALVFQEGRVLKGKWKKEDLNSQTRFFDEQNNRIPFTNNPVWIEVLPLYNSFSYE